MRRAATQVKGSGIVSREQPARRVRGLHWNAGNHVCGFAPWESAPVGHDQTPLDIRKQSNVGPG
jgi:hypothetical protein